MTTTPTGQHEPPFKTWHHISRLFYSKRLNELLRVVADNPQAIVYVRRFEDGLFSSDIALWSGEVTAAARHMQSPPAVMQRLPQAHVDFVPVPLRDVFGSDDLLTALRDRLGSLLRYDPEHLADIPEWIWTFPQHSHCNLLVEDGRLIAPPGWELRDGHYAELRAEHSPVRIIDGKGRMGLMNGAGEVLVPCTYAYLSKPRHGAILACEANTETMPRPWDPCDLLDMSGRQLNPPGLRIRAGTLWHDIAVLHPDSPDAGGLTGFMTSKGEPLGRRWKSIRAFADGYSAVQDPVTGLWGYMNTHGTLVISPCFTQARSFDRDRAVVALPDSNSLVGLIDPMGVIVVAPKWRELKWLFGKYFVATDADSAIGLIDNRGNVVIEPFYPSREEDAEINAARGTFRRHPFVRMLGHRLKERVRSIPPDDSLASLVGVFSPSWANDIELLAAGLWGRRVVVIKDYATEHMRTPIAAGSTGSISWHFPVTASIFDLSKEAPVRGLPIMPHASIGIPWELLRFADKTVSTALTSSPETA